jgi:hypothetical protein
VDGTEEGFRGLSHWPGHRTPAALRHDLSTGIALGFARLSPAEQRAFLGPFEVVANNHYDTDGALSVFAVLRPEAALPRAQAMLAAAATGDFSTWQGPEALAVDLTVMRLTHGAASPLAVTLAADASDAERWAAGYAWLVEHLPAVLDDPFAWRSLWEAEHARAVADVERVQAGTGVSVRRFPGQDLALVSSDRPITSPGLHLAAGDALRVLLVRPSRTGFRYRFRYRVESWFELASRRPLPRVPLAPAVEALERAESSGRWWCGTLGAPIVELGHGSPERAAASVFDDPDVEGDPESRLPPSAVIDALRAAFDAGPSATAPTAGPDTAGAREACSLRSMAGSPDTRRGA